MVVVPHNQNKDKALDIYNVRDGALIKRLVGHSNTVLSAIWCADGSKIISSDLGGNIKVWNVSTGGEILSIKGQKNADVRVHHATPTKAIGNSDSVLKVWDIVSGKELMSIMDYNKGITISSDGRYFAAGFKDYTMRVYPINGGEPVFTIGNKAKSDNDFEADGFTPLAFKDANTILASRNRTISDAGHRNIGELVTVDISSGKITTLQSPLRVSDAAYSADGKKIISTSMKPSLGNSATSALFIRILDAETGAIVSKIAMSTPNIWGIDVSSTENKIAAFCSTLVPKKFEYSVCFWEFE